MIILILIFSAWGSTPSLNAKSPQDTNLREAFWVFGFYVNPSSFSSCSKAPFRVLLIDPVVHKLDLRQPPQSIKRMDSQWVTLAKSLKVTEPNLRFPAVCCENRRFSVKISGFLRPPNAWISRRRGESAKIYGFLRKSASWALSVTLVGSVPTTPGPNTSATKVSRYKWEAYRDTNWWRIHYSLPRGVGILLQKYRDRNGRCVSRYLSKVSGSGVDVTLRHLRSVTSRRAPDYSSNLCPPKIWSIWLFQGVFLGLLYKKKRGSRRKTPPKKVI